MTAINSALIATVSVQTVNAFTVTLLTMPTANTEYSVALPLGTKAVTIQNRNEGLLKLRHVSGGDHFTIAPYVPLPISGILGSATITLYLESPKAAQTVEILSWS
jgi:hypothetical protein